MKKVILSLAFIAAMASCSKDQTECRCLVEDQELYNSVWRTYNTYTVYRNTDGECDKLDETINIGDRVMTSIIVGGVTYRNGGHQQVIDCGI